MKISKAAIFGFIFSCCFITHAARIPALRYRLSDGQTNVYKIEIEMRGESGTEGLGGNIFITSRHSGTNAICLSPRGTLTPKRDNMTTPYFGGFPRARWMSPITFGENAEIYVDDRGQLLRVAGDLSLPIPLGSVAQLLVEPLPAESESHWKTTDELAVLDEPFSLGPAMSFLSTQPPGMPYYGGFYDSRRSPGVLAVTRKTYFAVKTSTQDEVTVSNHFTLASRMQCGAEPRVNASGDGEFVLDHESGFLRRSEMRFKTVSNTENLTRRGEGSVRLKLLEGQERENALQQLVSQFPNRPSRKLTSDEIQKVISDLDSNQTSVRDAAASKLQSSELSQASPALLDLMTNLVNDSEMPVRMAAAKVLADYGTSEQVPVLIKLLKSTDTSMRWSAIRGLSRLKDKRAAEPLANIIARGDGDGYQATEAIAKLGPEAEDAVLPLLKERNIETLRQACTVLKQIGTQKSLQQLRQLMLDPDQSVNSAAAEAVREITSRQ